MPEATPPSSPAPGAASDTGPAAPGVRQPAEARNLLQPSGKPPASGLTADEEQQLAALQAKAARAREDATVEVKLEQEGLELHYGGHKITSEWGSVPERMVGPLTTAAADGGVTLIQKES